MRRKWTMSLALLAALALLSLPWGSARAGVFLSVGVPGPYYGPYYHHHYYYYGPRVVVAAPPVVVAAPPPGTVYVQPTVIYQQVPAPQTAPAPAPQPVPVNPGN
jgi:hypothetical protein